MTRIKAGMKAGSEQHNNCLFPILFIPALIRVIRVPIS